MASSFTPSPVSNLRLSALNSGGNVLSVPTKSRHTSGGRCLSGMSTRRDKCGDEDSFLAAKLNQFLVEWLTAPQTEHLVGQLSTLISNKDSIEALSASLSSFNHVAASPDLMSSDQSMAGGAFLPQTMPGSPAHDPAIPLLHPPRSPARHPYEARKLSTEIPALSPAALPYDEREKWVATELADFNASLPLSSSSPDRSPLQTESTSSAGHAVSVKAQGTETATLAEAAPSTKPHLQVSEEHTITLRKGEATAQSVIIKARKDSAAQAATASSIALKQSLERPSPTVRTSEFGDSTTLESIKTTAILTPTPVDDITGAAALDAVRLYPKLSGKVQDETASGLPEHKASATVNVAVPDVEDESDPVETPADTTDEDHSSEEGTLPCTDGSLVPKFYVPYAAPTPNLQPEELAKVNEVFENHPTGLTVDIFESEVVTGLLRLSKYFSRFLFNRIDTARTGRISRNALIGFWSGRFLLDNPTSNFFYALKHDVNDFLWSENFEPPINEILERHPGMDFLRTTPDFQKRYLETVICRILYHLDIHCTGRIYLEDIRNSNLVESWLRVDEESDLNSIRAYFCYEHFYVIYCKFWDLDSNHDFRLDKQDLMKYDQHAFSHRAVDRIVAVAGHKFTSGSHEHLSYEDFVYFLMNDEDKTTDRSIHFWFEVVDIDGDGVIRDHEMNYFYEQQCERLEALGQEVVQFEDILCQMNDMLSPAQEGQYKLADFKANRRHAGQFFNILLSLTKFVLYEQRDPFQMKQDLTDYPDWGYSDWDRYCKREYNRLALDEDDSESGHSVENEDFVGENCECHA